MDWQPYIKASWEIVMAAEGKMQMHLDSELEAYLVHMVARNFRNAKLTPDIVCLELGQARHVQDFRNIGDGCLFIDAWHIRRARLVSNDYYQRMGQIAYGYAATASRPFDALFDRLGQEFKSLSKVLTGVRELCLDE